MKRGESIPSKIAFKIFPMLNSNDSSWKLDAPVRPTARLGEGSSRRFVAAGRPRANYGTWVNCDDRQSYEQ